MLSGLSIRDIVLIDRLDLRLQPGLCVLTGETGAGKSILLDSLGLALGMRADSGLVRRGAGQGSVVAEFMIAPGHPAWGMLREQGIEAEESLLLRRVVGADGRSRAFVNDQPVSVGLLRRIGDVLVEIHGQSAEQALFDTAVHRAILDAFGGLEAQVAAVGEAYGEMKRASAAVEELKHAAEQARRDEEYLRHAVGELEELDPKAGEEAELAETRLFLQNAEKVLGGLRDALAVLEEGEGVESRLRVAQRALEQASRHAGGRLDEPMQALDRAAVEMTEAVAAIAAAGHEIDLEPQRLDQVEERLFALRAASRKHQVNCDDLPALRDDMARKLAAVTDAGERLARLEKDAAAARRRYRRKAEALGGERRRAALRLDAAVASELDPLKLGGSVFRTLVTDIAGDDDAAGGPDGIDRVVFQVATNPGSEPGPLARIASGGELSRFMLALKVALAGTRSAPTLVFDEADRGIGGATANAVGERLARLAESVQVLVVTHSPQVAARGAHHWRVSKRPDAAGSGMTTRIEALNAAERQEEVARMLAGAEVTPEARAAASSLMSGGTS